MVVQGWPILDSDGHVVERDSEICEFLEEPFRSGDNMLNFPFFPTLDGFHRGLQGAKRGIRKGYIDAHAWVNFLDEIGIESSVLYPTAGLGYGLIQDPEWATILGRGYNNWFHERFHRVSPRLRGVALIPLQDVPQAVNELTRSITKLGAVGAVLPGNGGDIGIRQPLGHPDFWPIYAEAERLDCPVSVHGAPSLGLGFNFFKDVFSAATLEHPVAQMIQMTSMVFSGVFDEFPRLRVAFLEAGAGWVPFMIDRLERLWEVAGIAEDSPGRMTPEQILTSGRIFFTCEGSEDSLRYAIERLGDEVFMYASDFPHETDAPRAKREIAELLEREDIAESSKQKIFKDNVLRFYGR
jgi:predicted TIM-barrel fold metal-dependent hydrolase